MNKLTPAQLTSAEADHAVQEALDELAHIDPGEVRETLEARHPDVAIIVSGFRARLAESGQYTTERQDDLEHGAIVGALAHLLSREAQSTEAPDPAAPPE